MKKIASALLSLILFVSTAQGADYAACIVGGVSKICPGDVQLKPGFTLALAAIPTLDAAHLPIVTEAKGGFGADISGLGTGFLRRAGANSYSASAIVVADIATALATGGGAVKGTVVTATTRVETPTVGTASGAQHGLPTGTGDLVSVDATQTLSSKTMSSPVMSGTATGTYTLGGTPTLGADLTATGRKFLNGAVSANASGTYPLVEVTAVPAAAVPLLLSFAGSATARQRMYYNKAGSLYLTWNASNSGTAFFTKDDTSVPAIVMLLGNGSSGDQFGMAYDANAGTSSFSISTAQKRVMWKAGNPQWWITPGTATVVAYGSIPLIKGVGSGVSLKTHIQFPMAFDTAPTTFTFTTVDSAGVDTATLAAANITQYGASITVTTNATDARWMGYVTVGQ